MRSARALLLTLALLGGGCSPAAGQALGKVEAAPPPASPELRDVRNRLDVHYHLNRPARVSSRIVGPNGNQWVVATDADRPTSGDYVLQFDGTVAGPGANERSVLPDGDYTIVLDVRGGGSEQQFSVPLPVRDADANPPAISELALLPDHISPNYDARDDVTHISFRVAKDALVSPFLDTADASAPTRRVWMGEEVKTAAGEATVTWDGTANGQPVASGDYLLGIRARDQAGNVVESSRPLVIEQSGVPEASIVLAHIGPLQIIRGDEVCIDAVVRNSGQTTLRTEGPDPGYVYNSFDTFTSIEDHQFAEHAGYWRVGLSTASSPELTGATYPYRWGFGHDLQPGEEADVHGCVRVMNEQDRLVFFAGLIQENVAIHNAGAGLVRVQIST